MRYFHSVHLIESKCKGCVSCIKRCPTEAIRVRDGKANILEERCIDCGECVRTCPNKAKDVLADQLSSMERFKHTVAVPAPALYGQFREGTDPRKVLAALFTLGFDDVLDVAFAAHLVAERLRNDIIQAKIRPVISSACPAVVRLIQVRFPNLIEHIATVASPMRIAARLAREEISAKTGIAESDIGVFFITPCPAKVSAVNEPAGFAERCLDGAIPIAAVFPMIQEALSHGHLPDRKPLRCGTRPGIGWARAGGENQCIAVEKHLAVDGIHNVIDILENVERGKLHDMQYIEAQACIGGCVGGVLTVENSFITRRRVRILASDETELPTPEEEALIRDGLSKQIYDFDTPILPRPTLKLDEDMAQAIRKLAAIERMVENLPGLDCGSCGAPNCRALAEDVVRGLAAETDCVFKLRERVQLLAEELMQAALAVPGSMGATRKNSEQNDTAATDQRTKPEGA
jgi:Na+-translocating ferredoxin:NAD+ oxidoreductase RNF subunit RnfB